MSSSEWVNASSDKLKGSSVHKRWIYNGLKCMIRKPYGAYYCGYVEYATRKRTYANASSRELIDHIDIHGGITFQGTMNELLETDESDTYWIGFDCGHSFDLDTKIEDGKYMIHNKVSEQYVIDEVNKLAVIVHRLVNEHIYPR